MIDCQVRGGTQGSFEASDIPIDSTQIQGTPTYANTIIIFDWDDTLLSSSWLASNRLSLNDKDKLPQEAVDQLKMLEAAVIRIINKALLYGDVHLVTNAEDGWVELSAEAFLPGVVSLFPKVNIISARSSYQYLYPDQPSKWKVEAFKNGLEQVFQGHADVEGKLPCDFRNVISLGDSMHERLALKHVTSTMSNTYSKSVKFVERPSIDQLEREISIMEESFEYLCTYTGNLDLMLVVEMLDR